jgi:hypothetical protein
VRNILTVATGAVGVVATMRVHRPMPGYGWG